jgi:hypothetical protein
MRLALDLVGRGHQRSRGVGASLIALVRAYAETRAAQSNVPARLEAVPCEF